MADKNVHMKCSDGVSNRLNCHKYKMPQEYSSHHSHHHAGAAAAANGSTSSAMAAPVDRIKQYYPNVNEDEFPLPRAWSSHEKCPAIGLTQNNLRVHYKGMCAQVFHITFIFVWIFSLFRIDHAHTFFFVYSISMCAGPQIIAIMLATTMMIIENHMCVCVCVCFWWGEWVFMLSSINNVGSWKGCGCWWQIVGKFQMKMRN